MSSKHLGEHFDIHGGGSDLQFPHHENEIAQSCCANNGKYVNTWIHTGMVQVNKEKMSKSLDNFFTVREVLKTYDAESVRYFLISGHYRSQLNYSQENLDQARSSLERIYTALRGVEPITCDIENNEYVAKFRKAMNDDFNTPILIAHLFEAVKVINQLKDQKATITSRDLEILKDTMHAFIFDVLGLTNDTKKESADKIDGVVELLITFTASNKCAIKIGVLKSSFIAFLNLATYSLFSISHVIGSTPRSAV
jgi:cysteinyl-tRNA synthetase